MILVVDDEPSVRRLVSAILQSAGHEIQEAQSAAEALHFLRQNETPIELLLTDIVMPGMNGLSLAARVHHLRPEVPILFMSGFASDYEVELSGSICLQKPFTAGQLMTAIEDALRVKTRSVEER